MTVQPGFEVQRSTKWFWGGQQATYPLKVPGWSWSKPWTLAGNGTCNRSILTGLFIDLNHQGCIFLLKNGYSPQHKFKSRKFIKLVLILLVNLAVLLSLSNFISVHYKPSQDSDKIWTLKSDTFMKTWRYLGNEIHTWLKRSCWAIKSLSVWKHHSKIEWLCLGMLSQSRSFN